MARCFAATWSRISARWSAASSSLNIVASSCACFRRSSLVLGAGAGALGAGGVDVGGELAGVDHQHDLVARHFGEAVGDGGPPAIRARGFELQLADPHRREEALVAGQHAEVALGARHDHALDRSVVAHALGRHDGELERH